MKFKQCAGMVIGFCLAVSLAACGSEPTVDTPVEAPAASEAPSAAPIEQIAGAQPAAFAQCGACHSVQADGPRGIGPKLVGVFGTPSASRGDFNYSPALRAAALEWDEETLDAFLTNPQETVPGTMMAFGGISDAAQRKEIIDYLATLR